EMVQAAVRSTGGRRAVVVTAASIACTPAEKRALWHAAAAGARSVVVDLESAAYVAAAAAARVPWLVLRAVTDTADEELPALLERARGGDGGVSRAAVVRSLFAEPTRLAALVPALWSLRERLRRAASVLGEAAAALA